MEELGDEEEGRDPERKILETHAEEREWYLECERVRGRLAVGRPGESNEWRMHMELLKRNFQQVAERKELLRPALERLSE